MVETVKELKKGKKRNTWLVNGPKICARCNAEGGKLVPRSHVQYAHFDDKLCEQVRTYRLDHNILESVVIVIKYHGDTPTMVRKEE